MSDDARLAYSGAWDVCSQALIFCLVVRTVFRRKKNIGGGGGGGRTQIAWPKATARGRVREGYVPPPARSAKLKLPPFYKVNGKLKRGLLIIYTCSCCVTLSMEKKKSSSGQGGNPKYGPGSPLKE